MNPAVSLVLAWVVNHLIEALHNSCNTGTRGLSDMSTLSPHASGGHIRQTTRAHVTYKICSYPTQVT